MENNVPNFYWQKLTKMEFDRIENRQVQKSSLNNIILLRII